MNSIPQLVRKRKPLRPLQVISAQKYDSQPPNTKVELIRTLDIGVCFHSCCSTLL